MAGGLQDIIIKIFPEIETKQYAKDLQYLADSSKNAMEKAYRGLDKSISLALHEAAKGTDDIEFGGKWQQSIDDMVSAFREMQDYMQETGLLPEGVDTKLYQAYANIIKMNEAYQNATNEAIRLNEAVRNMPDEEFTKVRQQVTEAALQVNKYEKDIEAVEQEMETLGRLEALPKVPEDRIKKYDTITNKIRELKIQSKQLYEQAYAQPKGSAEQVRLLQERSNIEKQIAGQERALKTIGAENIRIIQQMRDLAGQLTFKPGEKSMEDLQKEAERLTDKLEKAKDKWQSLMSQESTMTDNRQSLSEDFDAALIRVKDLEAALVAAAQRITELEGNSRRVTSNFNNWRVVGFSLFRVLGSLNTIASDIARSARRIVNFFKQLWGIVKKVAGAFKNLRNHIKGTADEHAKSFKQMIKDVFKYSLGIRSLFMLFRRLRTYIKEAFTEMAKQIPEVNARLVELKSSFYALKGSLGTALEPALAVFKNSLVTIIDLLAKALTYVGMFIAALSGRGYVYQAKKVAQSIGDAAGSAKELNKQLQGFDELNNLTSNNGGGGGAESPLAQFEKVDVPDWIKKITDQIKRLVNDILEPIKKAWKAAGEYVVEEWKRAFKSVGTFLSGIVNDFVKAWKSGLGEIISLRFFQIIGDLGGIIANIADALKKAWDYNDNGYKIWVAILQIVEKILTGIQKITADIKEWTKSINLTPAMTAFRQWLESLVPVVQLIMDILYDIYHDALKPILNWAFDGENSGVAIFFRILKKFNDELNMPKIREDLDKIWSAIGRFGKTVGEGLLIFMNKMLGYLKDWLNSDDFTKWCEDVAAWLDSIEPADIAEDLEQVWRILKNVAEWVWKIIKYVIDHKDVILDTLELASEHLDTIAKVAIFGKLATDIGRFVINLAVFIGSMGRIFGTAGTGLQTLSAGIKVVTGALSTVAIVFGGIVKEVQDIENSKMWGTTLAKVLGFDDDTINKFKENYSGMSGTLNLVKTSWEAITGAIHGNKEELNDFKESMKNSLLTYDQIVKAAQDASKTHLGYKDNMKELHKTLLDTHPELKNLKDALEESGIKIGNNTKRLLEINDGLQTFRTNGGNATETLAKLGEKYGDVDKKTQDFFNSLGTCEDKYAGVIQKVDDYNAKLDTSDEKETNLIKTYKNHTEVLEDMQKKDENVVGQFKTHWDIVNQNKTATEKGTAANADYSESSADMDDVLSDLNETLKLLADAFSDTKGSESEMVDYTPEFTGSMEDMQGAMDDTSQKASETGDNIVAGIKEPLQNANFDKEAHNTFDTLFKALEFVFDIASPAKNMEPIGNYILLGIVEGFKQKFDDFKRGIQDFYDNTVKPWFDKDKWTFDGIGQGLKETFEKVKDYIRTPINDVLGFVEKFVNGIIDAFNSLGGKLGDFDFDIPDKLAEKFNLPTEFKLSLPKFNHITIPKLAQGAVIPPNNEFLAVLGDQKSGTNIESPLSTMVEAFNMANKGGNEQEIALLQEQNSLLRQILQKEFSVSERQVFNGVINQNNIFKKATGVSALA